MGRQPRPAQDRFWEKVNKDGPVHPVLGTPCWLWTASCNAEGYGTFRLGEKTVGAHRTASIWEHGPIPEGLECEHACHTYDPSCDGGQCVHRRCVNPDHIERVTPDENKRRGKLEGNGEEHRAKTHCPHGHTLEDAYRNPDGSRKCRTCAKARAKAHYETKKHARHLFFSPTHASTDATKVTFEPPEV